MVLIMAVGYTATSVPDGDGLDKEKVPPVDPHSQ